MHTLREYATILQSDRDPIFYIHMEIEPMKQCQRLAMLTFEQSLRVIVLSIPHMGHDQWCDFRREAEQCAPASIASLWCRVGNTMRRLLPQVQNMLQTYNLPQAVICAEKNLAQGDSIEQFAFMACLYVNRKQDIKAQMLLTYLLQQIEQDSLHLKQVLHFYQRLTLRQRDVVQLTAQGYTNQEIADTLCLAPASVAEHLTGIYLEFTASLNLQSDKIGTRYRLIHWMTRLYLKHPELMVEGNY